MWELAAAAPVWLSSSPNCKHRWRQQMVKKASAGNVCSYTSYRWRASWELGELGVMLTHDSSAPLWDLFRSLLPHVEGCGTACRTAAGTIWHYLSAGNFSPVVTHMSLIHVHVWVGSAVWCGVWWHASGAMCCLKRAVPIKLRLSGLLCVDGVRHSPISWKKYPFLDIPEGGASVGRERKESQEGQD